MGKMYEKEQDWNKKFPIKGTNSTWTHQRTKPDPAGDVTMPYGPVLMLGKEIKNTVKDSVIGYQAEVVLTIRHKLKSDILCKYKGITISSNLEFILPAVKLELAATDSTILLLGDTSPPNVYPSDNQSFVSKTT